MATKTDDRRVVIRHADGREYAVRETDFYATRVGSEQNTYQKQGFKVVRWEDGEPYVAPPLADRPTPEPLDPGSVTEAPRRRGPTETAPASGGTT